MLGQQGVGATIDDRALLLENAQQDFLHDVIVIDHQYAHSSKQRASGSACSRI
jgi:hypothetical protein